MKKRQQIKKLIEEILNDLISKTIIDKKFESNTKFGMKARSYLKLERKFNFETGIYYICTIPNFACPGRTKIKAITRAFEHETIGMAKYGMCKDLLKIKEIRNFTFDDWEG